MSCTQPNIKVRPIVSYCLHPLRVAFRRIARALAVLVTDARKVVMEKRPTHLPMWQLHSGSAEWLQRLVATRGGWGLEEFDVSDCFLNTPRGSVLAAVKFWMVTTQSRTRRQPCFGISKDGKAGGHRGRPPVMHYWVITAEQIMSVCQWDLENNDTFEIAALDNTAVVVGQRQGLPIGGHLSAAYVELLALKREYEVSLWPASVAGMLTARYRDNFFVAVPHPWAADQRAVAADELSELLQMPVVPERGGDEARCLELRIKWVSKANAKLGEKSGTVKVVLAYRTDADRQGESGDLAGVGRSTCTCSPQRASGGPCG